MSSSEDTQVANLRLHACRAFEHLPLVMRVREYLLVTQHHCLLVSQETSPDARASSVRVGSSLLIACMVLEEHEAYSSWTSIVDVRGNFKPFELTCHS